MLRGNLLCSSLCTLFLVLSLGTTDNSLHPHLEYYIHWEWTVLSAIPSRRCAPVPLSSLWPLVGLFQYSHVSYRGAQIWTQSSRCDLSSDEEKGRITFLHILAILCQLQIRMPLAFFVSGAYCWISFTWCPAGTSSPVFQDCFISRWPSACPGTWGCSSQGAGTLHFLFLIYIATKGTAGEMVAHHDSLLSKSALQGMVSLVAVAWHCSSFLTTSSASCPISPSS